MLEPEAHVLKNCLSRGNIYEAKPTTYDIIKAGAKRRGLAIFEKIRGVVVIAFAGDHPNVLEVGPGRCHNREQDLRRVGLAVRR